MLNRFSKKLRPVVVVGILLVACTPSTRAQDSYERPPIEYSKRSAQDRVALLKAAVEAGKRSLAFDQDKGYLPAVLAALEVPIESQVLVFSKTSLQRAKIAPRRPRAVYFSDDVYVGYCQTGAVIELAAVDPALGMVFYTLDQQEPSAPKFTRQGDNCLICHSSTRTEDVPGLLARSLSVAPSGEPVLSAGSIAVDHRTPLEDRWGGWYVTGTTGKKQHRGNRVERSVVASGAGTPPKEEFVELQSVAAHTNVDRYLSPHSDVVALMVLEHQLLVQNRLTRAHFEAQSALYYQADLNRIRGLPAEAPVESAVTRIASAGDALVDAMLLIDEAPLDGAVVGTSGFAEKFVARGPRDRQGRSLRELELTQRMFSNSCSYFIYSPMFDALPGPMKSYVWTRLGTILRGDDPAAKYAALTAADRSAIVEILQATKPDLPAGWPGP